EPDLVAGVVIRTVVAIVVAAIGWAVARRVFRRAIVAVAMAVVVGGDVLPLDDLAVLAVDAEGIRILRVAGDGHVEGQVAVSVVLQDVDAVAAAGEERVEVVRVLDA